MSSHTKDPLEKQDPPSGSSESHSDSELDEAEGSLEHLKLEEGLSEETTKDTSNDSKPVDSPNQESTLTSSGDLFDKIYAEQKGLRKHRQVKCGASSDPENKATSLMKEKEVEAKGMRENIGAKMVETEFHTMGEKDIEMKSMVKNVGSRREEENSDTNSTQPFVQSSTAATATSKLQEKSPVGGLSNFPEMDNFSKLPAAVVAARFMFRSPRKSSSSKVTDYDSDGSNTLADVSEIHSEVADISTEGSVYHDAPETIERKDSPSYASAVEMQSSDLSDTDISEIQEEIAPPPTPASSSVSTSTTSGESKSESMQDEHISEEQKMPLKQGRQNVEINVPEDSKKRSSTRKLQIQKSTEVCDIGEGSPSKRRRPSKGLSDASTAEKLIEDRLRVKIKLDAETKRVMVTKKSCSALQSSSESPEPKSSSTDELHRKESSENKSLSSEKDKKTVPKPDLIPSRHHSTISKDSVLAEEEDRSSRSRETDPALMESKDATPLKIEISAKKDGEEADKSRNPSGTKPSTESSDQAYGSEGTLKDYEQSIDDLEYERSVGKSKRQPKVSTSPPPKEKHFSSPPKVGIDRPKKKARSDKMPVATRRTRHDSVETGATSVGLGNLQQNESISPPHASDYTPSDDEKETQL